MSQRYEVKGKIGHGGLGEVYLAVDTQLGREVAIKRMRPAQEGEAGAATMAEDLLREARTLSALQHPNIVTIFDVGRDETGPYVVMELLKGETLDAVSERGPLSVEDFSQMVQQSLEGVVAAQALGLVHRDLKPGNLMVSWLASGRFQVKILDFGLAKFSEMPVPQTQDQGDGIFGSIYFMAPEQFERLPLDGRTDLYSLGCIYYLVLTQRHPFEGRSPVDVMVSHMQHLVTPLHSLRRDVPAWMADWVMWLMARDQEDRPSDATMALQYFMSKKSGLQSAAATSGQPARPATPARPAAGARTQPVTAAATTRQTGARRTQSVQRRTAPAARREFKEKFSPVRLLVSVLIFGSCLGVIWHVYQDSKKPRPTPRDVLERVKGDAPQGDAQTVSDLVKLAGYGKTAEDISANAAEALAALKRVRGPSVADGLASQLKASSGDLRKLLTDAATAHPSPVLTATLLEMAEASAGDERAASLHALRHTCEPATLGDMIAKAAVFSTDADSRTYWSSVEGVLAAYKDRGSRAKTLAPFLRAIDSASRRHLLRVLGANGSPEASAALVNEFGMGGERAAAAAEALRTWSSPDESITAAVFDAARSGDRDIYLGAYCRTLARIPSLAPAAIIEGLKKAAPLATNLQTRRDFLSALGTITGPEAIALATELTQSTDTAMAEDAQNTLAHIKRQTEQVRTLTAGENRLEGSAAIVAGDASETRWDPLQTYITGWRSARTRLAFDFIVARSGEYKIEVEQSAVQDGFTCAATIGGTSFENPVRRTASSDDFQRVTLGTFTISREGPARLWLEPARMEDRTTLMNVRRLIITAP